MNLNPYRIPLVVLLLVLLACEAHAQVPTYEMPWLGRIRFNMHSGHPPALMPKFRDGKDWLFWPEIIDGTARLRVRRFETLDDTVYVDFGPLVNDSIINLVMFRGGWIRYGDINGDGRPDFTGGSEFWLRSNDTGHTLQAMELIPSGAAPLSGGIFDLDGDGFGDIVAGTTIRWGDTTRTLSTYSRVDFTPVHGNPWVDGEHLDRAKGQAFALVGWGDEDRSCQGDTARSWRYEHMRYVHVNETDIAAHAPTIGIDTTTMREVLSFSNLWCPEECRDCQFMPTETKGRRWAASTWFTYRRHDLWVYNDYHQGHRLTISDTGVTWLPDGPPNRDGYISIGRGGGNTYGIPDSREGFDFDFGFEKWIAIMHFPDSASLFFEPWVYIEIPDSVPPLVATSQPGCRFPDITGDGRPEIGMVYRHKTEGWVVDVFDAFGAVPPTSGGGDPLVAAPTLDLTLRDKRATWTGGTAPTYDIRIHDVQGRLLRTATVQGHELPTTGVDLRGLSGNVFITVEGGGAKFTYPVQVE